MKNRCKLGLKMNKEGLIPAVIQEDRTGEVLMVGFLDEEALYKTRESGLVWLFSRSRKRLWLKGETSGNKLIVREILSDCDTDTLLIKVKIMGKAVCHNGTKSCFINRMVQI